MMRLMRYLFLIVALGALILTAGFYFQMPWATGLWMWPDGRLTYIFIASITAAIAVPLVWLAWSQEWGAAGGGAVNLAVQAGGMALFLGQLSTLNNQSNLLVYALVFGVFTFVNLGILWWSRRFPLRDTRPLPRPVYVSFVIFVILLFIVSVTLLLKTPNIFPWPLLPETSVMIGWVFAGTVVYFALPLFRPTWGNAQGQLLGFLAYDVILILPFINHFSTVEPEHRLSLIIYTGVVVYSALLAIYYLFINRATRLTVG